MSDTFVVREAVSEADVAEVRRLVLAHVAARADTPGVEHMHADAARLPGPYVPPRGGLWMAESSDGVAIGCVALHPLSSRAGEVKRMFVDADWRGRGVGRRLLVTLIEKARDIGYSTLRLGTLDDMHAAKALYASLGFTPVARYRMDEMMDTRFYELSLTE